MDATATVEAEQAPDEPREAMRAADEAVAVARAALVRALDLHPNDRALLERVRAIHEAAGDWSAAIGASVRLAEQIAQPVARARAFVGVAAACAAKTRETARAVALYEAALADDPQVPQAFEQIERVLLEAGDAEGLEAAYLRQLARLGPEADVLARTTLLARIARVRQEQLDDPAGAIQALDELVTLRPDDVGARLRLADLLAAHGHAGIAARTLEQALAHAPTRPEVHRAIRELSLRTGDADRAWLAAAALVHLAAATAAEDEAWDDGAPRTLLRPTRALDAELLSLVEPEGWDADVASVLATIAPAAIAVRLEDLRAAGLSAPDPRDRVDPEHSTVAAVRTIGWAARLLAVPPPSVYVRSDDLGAGVATLPLPEPAVALGRSLLGGRSLPELAFVAVRDLAFLRFTSRVLPFYPTLTELRALFGAVVALVAPAPFASGLAGDAAALHARLGRQLDSQRRLELHRALTRMSERSRDIDLVQWSRATELAASRLGLLACGDVNVAARVIQLEARTSGGLGPQDRVRDLLAFSLSSRYATLRRAIGFAVGGPG